MIIIIIMIIIILCATHYSETLRKWIDDPTKAAVFLMAFKITIHVEKAGRLTLNLPPMG